MVFEGMAQVHQPPPLESKKDLIEDSKKYANLFLNETTDGKSSQDDCEVVEVSKEGVYTAYKRNYKKETGNSSMRDENNNDVSMESENNESQNNPSMKKDQKKK